MAIVEMPQLGESVTEGTILQWLKQPGDTVALDDSLCEIETEKVTAELPSPFAGTMGDILVPEGETVEVGVPLCEIVTAGEPAANAHSPGPEPARASSAGNGAREGTWSGGPMAVPPEERGEPVQEPERVPVAASTRPVAEAPRTRPEPRTRFYSPAVLRLAEQAGIDLEQISGTGVNGRVTRRDVERYIQSEDGRAVSPPAPKEPAAEAPTEAVPAEAAPAAVSAPRPAPAAPDGDYEIVQWTATRRTIADRMKQSNLEAPQAWTMVEADVTDLVARRQAEKAEAAEAGVDLTLLPYFTAAVIETLREYPALNARWEGDELRRYHRLHIGIAVSSEAGLVVPVIHDAGDLNVVGLARHINDLSERARARKLRIEDIEGGTFTVNNTGAFGSIISKPIVNYPQVGIVTMERATKRPVVVEGDAIAIRWMVNVCLSFDHRALDGHEAGGFLAALKARLEAAEM